MFRRGQLGKGIVALPVIIVVVLVLGLFIFLSSGIAVQNRPDKVPLVIPEVGAHDFLLMPVLVTFVDEERKELLLIDAVQEWLLGNVERDELLLATTFLLTDENNCFVLFETNDPIKGSDPTKGRVLTPGSGSSFQWISSDFEVRDLPTNSIFLDVKGEANEIVHFFGPCDL